MMLWAQWVALAVFSLAFVTKSYRAASKALQERDGTLAVRASALVVVWLWFIVDLAILVLAGTFSKIIGWPA